MINEPSRLGFHLQCFKCNGVGHIAARCPSRALFIQEDDEKVKDVKELVYDPNVEKTQDVEAKWEGDPSYLECIRAISPQVDDFKNFGVPRVNVVRCALAEQKDTNDWRRSALFQTYTNCGNKTCKVIIDSESCINAMFFNVVSCLGLKLTPHPNPYKASWVDTSSIAIKERFVVPFQFLTYKAKI